MMCTAPLELTDTRQNAMHLSKCCAHTTLTVWRHCYQQYGANVAALDLPAAAGRSQFPVRLYHPHSDKLAALLLPCLPKTRPPRGVEHLKQLTEAL